MLCCETRTDVAEKGQKFNNRIRMRARERIESKEEGGGERE